MMPDLHALAIGASWIASVIGLGLALWGLFAEKNPIQRLRFLDCGVVLLFSATLLRIVAQDRPMSLWDWSMVFLGPLFIAAALWRLARTACPPPAEK